MMDPRTDEEMKKIYQEALQEWLDKKFAEFGKWSFYSLLAAGLFALVYFILWANGWHKV